ncbi:hypothetical protein [Pedobacter nyackensis]|uniref:hypothetical protein n=1 Tax=Pedobacter nyackensis TaxID=475255 RepID=UPI00292DE4B6|nr:hypothetical protein [Pedobacter nyackensis]
MRFFIHGGTASSLSVAACVIYKEIYTKTFDIDFTSVLNIKGMFGASVLGCMLIALGYALLNKWGQQKWIGFFNIIVTVLSFTSMITPLAVTLPLDILSPELFPGLAIPMHFFPVLAFYTILPFFERKKATS